MPSLTLKTYQQQALASLERFLADARTTGDLDAAWARELARQAPAPEPGERVRTVPYRREAFGDTPCVCLRIPTGGGKTLMASHAIVQMARVWRQAAHPVALWLVPSTTIRDQTLRALQQSGHPYREALQAHYGQALAVLDLEAAPTLAVQELGTKAVVLVATIQSFRVKNTQGRNVYAFSEEFDTHFAHFAAQGLLGPDAPLERVSAEDLVPGAASGALTAADIGRVKHSLANLLALVRPLVVVDEAHNAQSRTSLDTLRRVAPSAVLELTATPVPKKANVLASVSARELQAEEMIKLPVMLAEHREWPAAVRDALLRRHQLEAECAHEPQYIRPIVLFQAQDKSAEVTPELLRRHLIDDMHVPEAHIVVATGDQRGLDGVDLFDPACPVRCVITVEALKEGWDCAFAYVLCSLQNVRSGKDVEQLLGRVLRMPYARRRRSPALNRAYAHVVARSFSEAAAALVDRMVDSMGFEALDAAAVLLPDAGVQGELLDATPQPALAAPVLTLEVSVEVAQALQAEPDIEVHWPVSAAGGGDAGDAGTGADSPPSAGPRLRLQDEVSDATLARVLAVLPARDHAPVMAQVAQHNQRVQAARAPAERGVPFALMRRLCVGLRAAAGEQQELHLFERQTLDEIVGFDLLRADPMPDLPGFALVEQSELFEIYVNQARVEFRKAQDERQLSLDAVPTSETDSDLALWLARTLRRDSLTEETVRRWCVALLGRLQRERGFSLTGLVRARHQVAGQAMARLEDLLATARQRGFRQLLLPDSGAAQTDWTAGTSADFTFAFRPGQYPARHVYTGRWRFTKHYYPFIHALKSQGEEFECARALDGLPEVKHWVRNVEQQERFSFWLPTATDYFYPDFVAELKDGRVLVVEYKGDAYASNDDSAEKRAVGLAWQRASAGLGLFVMVEKLLAGMDMTAQLRQASAGGRA
jgi:type III restriction enzyme